MMSAMPFERTIELMDSTGEINGTDWVYIQKTS